MLKKFLFDWKVHVLCFVIFVVAELIGPRPVGPFNIAGMSIGFTLFPLLFSLIIGTIFGLIKLVKLPEMEMAAPYIGLSIVWLIAKLASGIGPNIPALIVAGPAFFLQEFGNIGAIFLSIPVAIVIFRMGREAIGAGFSIGREPSLALMSSMYGLDTAEGRGTLGAYITGSVLGTLYFGIFASVLVALNVFSLQAIALAAGMGSASMMVAALAPMLDAAPHMQGEIMALASTSNLLTAATGLYFNMFLAIPISEWLYKKLRGAEHHKAAVIRKAVKKGIPVEEAEAAFQKKMDEEAAKKAANKPAAAQTAVRESISERWTQRGKVLIISGIFITISNYLMTMGNFRGVMHRIQTGEYLNPDAVVNPFGAIPGMAFFAIAIVLGFIVDDLVAPRLTKIKIPTIFYISIIGIVMGIPGFPGQALYVAATADVMLLSMGSVTLAYAGMAICKDLGAFKGQSVGIIVVSVLAFTGSFIGSAIIAEFVLRLTGAI